MITADSQPKFKLRALQGKFLMLPECIHQRLSRINCYAYAIKGDQATYQVFDRDKAFCGTLKIAIVDNAVTVSSDNPEIHKLVNSRRGFYGGSFA